MLLLWRANKACVVGCFCLYVLIAVKDRMLLRMQDFYFAQI